MKKKESDIFLALTGYGDWCDSLTEAEDEVYWCDPSDPADIERWFLQVVLPSMRNQPEMAKDRLANFLGLVDSYDFAGIIRGIDDLSPVPFTTDEALWEPFFEQIAALARDPHNTF